MNRIYQRAHLLLTQRRWPQAEAELRQGLAENSQDAELHRLLAWCLLQMERFPEAEDEARNAIGLSPDYAPAHQTLAEVLLERRRYPEAEAAATQAITFDPFDADAFATLAGVRITRENWKGALAACQQGLEIDAENVGCNNYRSLALVKLGRRDEAGQTIRAALARNPQDSFTHANQGWSLLAEGQSDRAFDHFREALAADPESDWARAGIVEAIKSRNFLYRWILQFFLFMARFSPGTQWMIMIGGFVLQRILVSYMDRHPEATVWCLPLIILYAAFAILTWLASPLLNLTLLTDRRGRHALTADQQWQGLLVGIYLLAALVLLGVSLGWRPSRGSGLGMASSLQVALCALPASMIFASAAGWPRWTLVAGTALLTAMALAPALAWTLAVVWPRGPGVLVTGLFQLNDLFLPAFVISQFLAVSMTRATPHR